MKTHNQVELIQVLYTTLRMLTDEDALAAIIVTDSSYPKLRRHFGDKAQPYNPSGLVIDPNREHGMVVDGLLILRGTTPVDANRIQ